MKIQTEEDREKTCLKIEGTIDVYETPALKVSLLEGLSRGDIILDLAEVSECDLAAVQLLYSALRTAHSRGRRIEISDISQNVIQAFESAAVKVDLSVPNE